jgi:hypothetical protein
LFKSRALAFILFTTVIVKSKITYKEHTVMTPKERHEFIRDLARTVFTANVQDQSNHEKYSELARRAVVAATALADALPEFNDPEPDATTTAAKDISTGSK